MRHPPERAATLTLLGAKFLRHFLVLLDVTLPVGGDVGVHEDRGDRALWLAQTTIDALVRMDVDHVVPFVDAVHRADVHAGLILNADTRLRNNVGHGF